jgi:DNA-binding transcriptional ArsR family regulator
MPGRDVALGAISMARGALSGAVVVGFFPWLAAVLVPSVGGQGWVPSGGVWYSRRYPVISTYANLRICRYKKYTAGMMSARRADSPPAPAGHGGVLVPEQVSAAVLAFTLLADPTRVRMLWALREEDHDVATLAQIAGCRPTVASQHLSKLRLAGLVEATRDGRRMVYRLRGSHVRNLLAEALFQADHQVSGEPVHD